MENINFTTNDILQKEFVQKMRGYDPSEVDSFLDDIIKDYNEFEKQINQLEEDNKVLTSKLNSSSNTQVVDDKKPMYRNNPSERNEKVEANMDILKRLSNLERRVFGPQDNNY
ncbi:cell division regulator GpsB [Lactobacillus sp. S2-2]|uniref:cell division regulator GpsB n=1 Tax=Lactobacillus sp. S2-2 TaxID=2692917 RepID=UPI001F362764|nr:cell division regulator GpsB [Lactobacillus sp. S2-2]MCF6515066.1 cell division regulator GpsB [Lactobacillus sp. S2-2]